MVDFRKLGCTSEGPRETEPRKLFASLPKSDNVNDLYDGQASVLSAWYERRNESDIIIKMPTGAGKTIVGLLIAQSYMNQSGGPAVYLVESKQLVEQALNQAKRIGVKAFKYEGGSSINASFRNGEALLIGSYQAMFNGKSTFDRGDMGAAVPLECIIVDDAHAALSTVRRAFSVIVRKDKSPKLFDSLTVGLGSVFDDINQGATYRDLLNASPTADGEVLEVPYWAYEGMIGSIERNIARAVQQGGDELDESLTFSWPLVRDGLRYCRMIIGCGEVSVAPYVPDLSRTPAFSGAVHRVYMSATFADESAIVRVFDVGNEAVSHPIAPRMLAGVGMKLILPVPEGAAELAGFAKQCASEGHGVVILSQSLAAAHRWGEFGIHTVEGDAVTKTVQVLNQGSFHGPVVLANRYNGVDLPGEACRLLIIDGLPEGGMDGVDRLEQKYLSSSAYYARIVAQRVEQGIGRASRGSSDYCAVALYGKTLVEWERSRTSRKLFSRETRALLKIGERVGGLLEQEDDTTTALKQVVDGDPSFMNMCASMLSRLVDEDKGDSRPDSDIATARAIRNAVRLWSDGHGRKGIKKLVDCAENLSEDSQLAGYLLLLGARIAYQLGDFGEAKSLHCRARELNPAIFPFQAGEATDQFNDWQIKGVFGNCPFDVEEFDRKTRALEDDGAEPSEYEMALENLGLYLGFESERHDKVGDGPDVFWKTGDGTGFVIEAKSGKKAGSKFDKDEQGQLRVAVLWCEKNHPELKPIPVSVHPTALSFPQAYAEGTLVLTTESTKILNSRVRRLVETVMNGTRADCSHLLDELSLRPSALIKTYMQMFKSTEGNFANGVQDGRGRQ